MEIGLFDVFIRPVNLLGQLCIVNALHAPLDLLQKF